MISPEEMEDRMAGFYAWLGLDAESLYKMVREHEMNTGNPPGTIEIPSVAFMGIPVVFGKEPNVKVTS